MPRITKQSVINASQSRFYAVVLFAGMVVLSSCGSSEPDKRLAAAKSKPAEFTGDWYDEYAAEKKTKKTSAADRRLFSQPLECVKAAKHALSKHDNERAYELANEALKRDPTIAQAYFIRGAGVFYSAFGEEKDAIKDLEKARDLGYKEAELFEVMAKLYDAKKEYVKAIEAVSYGLKVSPSKDLYRCRASLYESLGRREEALADLNTFIKMAPEKALGYYVRASLYQQLGRIDDALADYATCIKVNPDNTHAMTARANIYKKMGRDKEALAELAKLTEADQYDDDAIRMRGDIYAKLEKYDRAIADYTLAIKMSPDYARPSLEARAKMYEKTGRSDLARKDLSEAAKLKEKPAEKPVYEWK